MPPVPSCVCLPPGSAALFRRAVIMPNLRPPVTTTALALAYRDRILAALPPGTPFQPLMTLYLTDHTTPREVAAASETSHLTMMRSCDDVITLRVPILSRQERD